MREPRTDHAGGSTCSRSPGSAALRSFDESTERLVQLAISVKRTCVRISRSSLRLGRAATPHAPAIGCRIGWLAGGPGSAAVTITRPPTPTAAPDWWAPVDGAADVDQMPYWVAAPGGPWGAC